MKVYIIIVTYNAMKWAERCFNSLRKSSIPLQCIVVDNGSTDGTQDYISQNFPEIHFIQSPTNLGFGKANNIGIEKAYKDGADFFYLMNQDTWLFEDSIEKLLDVYDNCREKEEIGILSPVHVDGSGKMFYPHFEMYLARNTNENRIFSDIYCKHPKPFYEMAFINTAHWFIPRNVIEEIGGFNTYFFQGVEDHEFANRIKYRNKKIILCTNSLVTHDAKKVFLRDDTPENARKISLRAQRESRYLNPAYPYSTSNEKKNFYLDIFKLTIKGNIKESKFYIDMYKYFSTRFSKIEEARERVFNDKNLFLNL